MKKKFTLDDVQKAIEFKKCKDDIVYFAENYVNVPTPGGDKLIKLYEPQKKVLRSFLNEHYLVILKSRQTGYSTLCQVIVCYMVTFYANCVIGIISRDAPEASDFNRKALDMIHKLPKWLEPQMVFENAQSFKTTRGSQLWASAISPANPGAVFRGKSITILFIDEAAHARYVDEAWTGIAPALSKAQMDARENNIPYGTVILSTPNRTQGIGKWYFERWTQASVNPEGVWKPHKIHWTEIPTFANDPNWYSNQCEILENNPKKIAQELELQFIPAGGLFSETVYTKLQEIQNKAVEKIMINSSSWLWRFRDIQPNSFYMIGVDTASEFGSDYSTVEVIDFETMQQVYEFKGKLTVKAFVNVVKTIASLVPNNVLLVENNSYGNQVCEELLYDPHRTFNIHGGWKNVDIAGVKQKKFKPGITTDIKTRPLIFDALYKYVNDNPEIISSERLAMELISLVQNGDKVEADLGANDDLVMAYAFCLYARMYLTSIITQYANSLSRKTQSDTDDYFIDPESGQMVDFNWMRGMNNGGSQQLQPVGTTNDKLNKEADEYIKNNYHKLSSTSTDLYRILTGRKI